ncbi:MAG: serine/threonine protein phosphatase [Lachnospiraceae bacterium]|nr:serine/threonine protein phosphatase [Lachnospiraceae bacterium]
MHYCIGDVHGCFDEMIALLEKIERQDKDAHYIFVGDFVDRGPKVWETIEWVMEHITPDGKYQSVQGNHEQMVMQWYLEYCEWKSKKLRLSPPPQPNYDFMEQAKAKGMLDPVALKPIMDFFLTLPFHKVITVPGRNGTTVTYDIVHAWYDYDEPEDSGQQYMDNLWRREVDGNFDSDHIIIHGHTPTLTILYVGKKHSSPGMIVYRKNAINIDGGCVFTAQIDDLPGHLCGICLETLEEFYSPTLEERLPMKERIDYLRKYRSEPDPFREELLQRLPE